MDSVDTIVVGAGVVGLACARELARAGRDVLILEAESSFGTATSSRNSEVIHAGIYYPPASLKALLCLRGRELLYGYCARHGIDHQRTGKLIVAATAAQQPRLEGIMANARACGVDDLSLVDHAALRRLEPALRGQCALLSPSTGIVDSHALMLSLLGDAERGGAVLATHAPVCGVRISGGGIEIEVGGEAPTSLRANSLVNSAGLQAVALAGQIDGLDPAHVPSLQLARGNYFVLQARAPFSRLIYPVPEPGGLGIHLTLDLGGQARFGPDVEWIEEIDYRVSESRAAAFEAAVRSYWPGLPANALSPGYAGIRPKLHGADKAFADFRIDGEQTHGIRGLVNLFGIESPGLTASLAIAEHVRDLLAA